MTMLGGREVAAAARLAGFRGDEVKRAQAVAYAASRWQSHYEVNVPGSPSLTQWGLFGTNPNDPGVPDPRTLFDPVVSAKDAYSLWYADGGSWDWHPVTRALGGALLRGAWRLLDEYRLWDSREQDVAHVAVPLGHPVGVVPPWPLTKGLRMGGIGG